MRTEKGPVSRIFGWGSLNHWVNMRLGGTMAMARVVPTSQPAMRQSGLRVKMRSTSPAISVTPTPSSTP